MVEVTWRVVEDVPPPYLSIFSLSFTVLQSQAQHRCAITVDGRRNVRAM